MHKQVITIEPGGAMSGLQRKPNQGIDLRQFGRADIQRASLIEWDADAQAWFINVLQEAGKGPVTLGDYCQASPARPCIIDYAPSVVTTNTGWDQVLLFGDYDDAVKVEIAYLDALRLRGRF